MSKNVLNVKKSRYVSGGVTEVFNDRVDWWERVKFQLDGSDAYYRVGAKYVGRLDKIAEDYYKDSRLWWVIAQYNDIIDPYGEITEDLVLRLPTSDRIQQMIAGKTGGNESQRIVPLDKIVPLL